MTNELKSRQVALRRLHDDLRDSSFARRGWNDDVRARHTLGSDETVEHWFLAEHLLMTWSNWQGLFDRFCRYFGQPIDLFPKTWSKLIADCEVLVFTLARDRNLGEKIAKAWVDSGPVLDRSVEARGYDIPSIYTQIARSHERASLLSRAEVVQPIFTRTKEEISKQSVPESVIRDRIVFEMAGTVAVDQNQRLMEHWQKLPRRVQDQVGVHLRHYLHSTLGRSWLADPALDNSALLSISWRKLAVSTFLQDPAELSGLGDPISGSVAGLLDRLKTTISELGYEAVVEDLLSPDLIGGELSLLASGDVMVIPGHPWRP